jgi:hypothetical protein
MIDQPAADWGVSVESAVAEERPGAADVFEGYVAHRSFIERDDKPRIES